MVSGRCFIPKYPNIQEESTINDFIIMNLCSSQPATGTSNIVPPNKSGAYTDRRMKGRKIRLEKIVFKNKTGSTALSLRDCFLNTS